MNCSSTIERENEAQKSPVKRYIRAAKNSMINHYAAYFLRACLTCAIGLSVGLNIHFGQSCEVFVQRRPSSASHLEVIQTIDFKKKNNEAIEAAHGELMQRLKIAMSEQIITEVKSSSTMTVSESDGVFSEYFGSTTSTSSNTKLAFGEIEFCDDKENKQSHGKYTIQREPLAKAMIQECSNKLKALNSEIRGRTSGTNNLTTQPLKDKYDQLLSTFEAALYLDPTVDITSWEAEQERYSESIGKLENSFTQQQVNQQLQMAKDSLSVGKYFGAITILKRLNTNHPDDANVSKTLKEAESSYYIRLQSSVANLKASGEYALALFEIKKYCSILNCGTDIQQLEQIVRRDYFEVESEQLRSAIKFEEENNVSLHMQRLDILANVDFEEYNNLKEQFLAFQRTLGMRKARNEFDQDKYNESYALLNELENSYGKRDSELRSLKKKVMHAMFRKEVGIVKKKKPHTWSFFFGIEGLTNDIELSNASQFSMSVLTFAYTGAIYKKFRYENEFQGKRSDFLGLRFRMIDRNSPIRWPGADTATVLNKSVEPAFDLSIDGIGARIIHYSLGANYDTGWRWGSPNYYFLSLGLRIPFGPVSLMSDAILRATDYNQSSLLFSGSIQYRLDFNRKFGKKDKMKIRAELF